MLGKTKIYIVDFEDSFTYNLAAELFIYEKNIEVVSHRDFFDNNIFSLFLNIIAQDNQKIAVVLGPGPGNPNQYRTYFSKILKLRNHRLIYLMGVCLGHQLLSLIDGFKIRPSLLPIHGRQVRVQFKNQPILVQRYNSLGVFSPNNNKKEILIRNFKTGVSYQFHPESIGTEKKHLFFMNLHQFISRR